MAQGTGSLNLSGLSLLISFIEFEPAGRFCPVDSSIIDHRIYRSVEVSSLFDDLKRPTITEPSGRAYSFFQDKNPGIRK